MISMRNCRSPEKMWLKDIKNKLRRGGHKTTPRRKAAKTLNQNRSHMTWNMMMNSMMKKRDNTRKRTRKARTMERNNKKSQKMKI